MFTIVLVRDSKNRCRSVLASSVEDPALISSALIAVLYDFE